MSGWGGNEASGWRSISWAGLEAAFESKSIKIAPAVGHLLLEDGGVNHTDNHMKEERLWTTVDVSESLLERLEFVL